MTTGEPSPRRLRREPPRFRLLTVQRTGRLSPHLVRVTVGGPELEGLVVELPAASVRLLLPSPGADGLVVPTWTGNEFLLPDGGRPLIRTLTPRHHRPDVLELDVDVVIHADGLASEWALEAEVGARLALSGPGRGYVVDPAAPDHLLLGDETAIPAVSQLLEVMPPAAAVQVVVEVTDPAAVLDLPGLPGARIDWRVRPAEAAPGTSCWPRPPEPSCPRAPRCGRPGRRPAMQRLRRHLFEERGVPRSRATVRGYWKLGAQPGRRGRRGRLARLAGRLDLQGDRSAVPRLVGGSGSIIGGRTGPRRWAGKERHVPLEPAPVTRPARHPTPGADPAAAAAGRPRRRHAAARARLITGMASVVGAVGITGYLAASHAATSSTATKSATVSTTTTTASSSDDDARRRTTRPPPPRPPARRPRPPPPPPPSSARPAMAADRRFRAMGSDAHLVVVGGTDDLADRAQARIDQLEDRWSRFRPDSEISRLNRRAGTPVVVSPDTVGLVERATEAWRFSGGAFDPTVLGPMIRAGYDRSFDQLGRDVRPVPSLLGSGRPTS